MLARLEKSFALIGSPIVDGDPSIQVNIGSASQDLPTCVSGNVVGRCGSRAPAPLFKFSNVAFGTASEASFKIHDINLTIFSGSFVGITGPSGCG